jgi:NAD(P)H dehydrogenase (quinone)
MRVHIIIDHPWKDSFNFAILSALKEGLLQTSHKVDLLDLNLEQFNPVFSSDELALYANGGSLDPKVKHYQERLLSADYLVMIFPIWWYVMPVRLKGWMDKVLLPGFAFSKGQYPEPLLTHFKGAMILTTSGAPDKAIYETYHSAIDWVLCKGTLEFCGISPTIWHNFGDTGFAPVKDHENWLEFIHQCGVSL